MAVEIFSPVKINHFEQFVNLPYFHHFTHTNGDQATQMWRFEERNGGSGEYAWKSEKPEIVSVEVGGVVHGQKLGKTIVTARDALNPHNTDSIRVEVSKIESVAWLEGKLEVLENFYDFLTVIARDSSQRTYTNCTSLYLEFSELNEQGHRR